MTIGTLVELDLSIRAWKNKDRRAAESWPGQETLPGYLFLKGANEDTSRRESWAVVVEGQTVGRMMLRDWRETPEPSARLGTYFGPCSRKGFGREAYRQFLSTVPAALGLVWVYGDIHQDNRIAYNLSLKAGFRLYGEDFRSDAGGNTHRFLLVRYWVG